MTVDAVQQVDAVTYCEDCAEVGGILLLQVLGETDKATWALAAPSLWVQLLDAEGEATTLQLRMDHEWACGDGTCLCCCSVIVSGPFAAGLANAANLADSATTVGRRVRHTELQLLVDAATVQVAEQVNNEAL